MRLRHSSRPPGLLGSIVVGTLLSVLLVTAAIVVVVTILSGTSWALSRGNSTGGHLRFDGPSFPASDPKGNLYVADQANQRVVKLSPSGRLLAIWHAFAGFAGADNSPGPIAIDARNNVYVASVGAVQQFLPTGKQIARWALGFDPQGIAVDSRNRVYLADSDTNRIVVLSPTGARLAVWRTKGSGPHGIAIDAHGTVYVADTGGDRIEKFSSAGRSIALWGKLGRRLGQFDQPEGVAVDRVGNVYVGDAGNHRIQILSPRGKVLAWWGSWGHGRGQFEKVTNLFVSVYKPQGMVFVTDSTGDTVHVFSSDGKELAQWR